jgi:hypothetical protein
VAARSLRLHSFANGSSVPGVCSGQLVLPRDWTDRCEVTSNLEDADRLSVCANSQLHLSECRSPSPASPFRALVRETARRMAIEPRALAVRALLQLPRVASCEGWISKWQVQRELRIGAERLRDDIRAARMHVPHESFALRDLIFEEIDSSRAVPVLTSLHYLRSVRPGSLYFALVDPVDKLPVSLCSVSPLQWKCVGNQIRAQFAIRPERVWDITRLYSIDGAPANAISFLLSKVRTHFRRHIWSADLLVTAVDPNLGFAGWSYRAANWQQWMTVRARPYMYEKDHYVSPRQLREQFGTANLLKLEVKYPGRFQESTATLLDSMIFASSINGETKAVPSPDRRLLHR